MSVLEWKMCNFFKLEVLNVNTKYVNIKDEVTAHCSNMQYKIFCNKHGLVFVFLGDWECISFQASNKAINMCTITDDTDLLVIHEECSPTESMFKIYSVSKLLKRRPAVPVSSASLARLSKVTALKAYHMDTQLYLAVGLEKGSVLLYKSALSRDISTSYKILNVCVKPIKGIEFLRKDRGELNMFVCSDAGVFCYSLSANSSHTETKIIVDDMVASVNCCSLKPIREASDEQYFVVGREDALYCYTVEGRGPCFAIDGSKQIVRWFGKHLIVLKSTISMSSKKRSQLVIINIESNMMVLNEELSEVECIFPTTDYDNCLIFMKDGVIFTLRDQEIRYKLQHLYSKNLYDIALKLVEGQAMYPDLAANVFVHYGDHLLQRGDIEASVKMYIRTIGHIAPFRVIRKLLNFRYNEFLIQYLRTLMNTEGGGPQEYYELLQNCDRRLELPGDIDKTFGNIESRPNIETSDPMCDEKEAAKYFPEKSNGIEFFSEHGNWVVANYPFDVGDIVNRILSNKLNSKQQSIDIFINILLPLLLSNKDCVLEVLSSLDLEYRKNATINIVWAEILLQKWKSFGIDVNILMDFIKEHELQLSMNDIFIICRTHTYLPGIKMMYEAFGLNALNFRSFLKCCFMFPMDTNTIDLETNKYSFMWMQALSRDNLQSTQSSAFVKYVLSRTLHCNSHYTLTILQKISANIHFNLSHLNKALSKDIFLKQIAFDNFRDVVDTDTKLLQIKRLLCDYLQKPMEFRNSACDICKQPLKQPTIYYLCQHSYHKECLSTYSEITGCLACETISRINLERKSAELVVTNKQNTSNGVITTLKNISHKLSDGVFSVGNGSNLNKIQGDRTDYTVEVSRGKIKELQMTSTNPFESRGKIVELKRASTNPFDSTAPKQYDTNLNPFEKC